jgi:hypothetical protein
MKKNDFFGVCGQEFRSVANLIICSTRQRHAQPKLFGQESRISFRLYFNERLFGLRMYVCMYVPMYAVARF